MIRVFVVQQPSVFDRRKGHFVPKLDLTPAAAFGVLVFLLPPGNIYLQRLATAVDQLRAGLASFTQDDFLLTLGDPVAIAAATMIAAQRTAGRLKLLKWDGHGKIYIPIALELPKAA